MKIWHKRIKITNLLLLCSISALFVFFTGIFKENYYENIKSKNVLSTLIQRSFYIKMLCHRDFKNEGLHSNAYYKRRRLRVIMNDVYVTPNRSLAWCLVPKVASTSITSAFVKYLLSVEIKNLYDMEKFEFAPQLLLNEVYPKLNLKTFMEMKEKLHSFYIVRHPFERLVSAYKNKLVNTTEKHDGDYFYNTYSKVIVENYRKNKTNVLSNHGYTTSKVIGDKDYKYISSLSKNLIDQTDPNPVKIIGKNYRSTLYNQETDQPNPEPVPEPTFEEFVDYLLDRTPETYDIHWKPIYLLCHICDFDYDYVIRYEYFDDEFSVLIDHFKENGNLPSEFEVMHKNKNSPFKNAAAKNYISQLEKNKIMALYNIYKKDFTYFNYTINDYMT